MTDDTTKTGASDRDQVAAAEPYEVDYFARKHGLTQTEARDLIARIGNDREKLDAAAEGVKGAGTPLAQSAVTRTARKQPKARNTAKPPSAAAKPRTKGVGRAKQSAQLPAGTRRRSAAVAKSRQAPSTAKATTVSAAPIVSAVIRPIATRAKGVVSSVATAAEPVAARVRYVVASARRGSESAAQRVAATPAAAKRTATKALGATRTAAKSRTAVVLGVAAVGLVTGLAVNLGRKAIVQAPSVMAGDWFEAIKLEHKLALSLFEGLKMTNDTEPAKRTILLTQLTHALAKHAFTEENVIYPALREWGDKADADKLNHDHGYVKQHLYELDAIDPATPAFLTRIANFRADLEEHIAEEEQAIFPPLHQSLGETQNARITALANKEGFRLA